ncbi:RbsD/FucU domain-containing protein [Neorhizobium sp. NCHU2750]|uniref:RbsD/FucU family protein n=1 Tax=Neorhizobium sp. NCHU2750 TaxID=1825976 RepID=UPI000E73144D|nr:L-fucose mutarotase [Neorhizobium sp. NCHU2750]
MLKTIDPRLSPDVLHLLATMGHGDSLALVDANFPVASAAARTVYGKPLSLANLTLGEAAEAVLSLMPLDDLGAAAACRMHPDGEPDTIPPAQAEVQAAIDAAETATFLLHPMERNEFYAHVRNCFAVIQTGERRFYGCVTLRKGVIAPPSLID